MKNPARFIGWGAVALALTLAVGYGVGYVLDAFLTYDEGVDLVVYGIAAIVSFAIFWPKMIGHQPVHHEVHN